MSDLKTLFHNPDELSQSDLYMLRKKISLQRNLPVFGFFTFGFTMPLFYYQFVGKSPSTLAILGVAAIGYGLGANASQTTFANSTKRRFDRDISSAFDERFMR